MSERETQTHERWPDHLPVVQVRVARPTDKLAEVVSFYRDALGLEQIGSFEGHAGYDGVMLGLPGRAYHLEFTSHAEGSACPAPSKDNLLVLYVADAEAMRAAVARLRARPRARRAGEPILGRARRHVRRPRRLARRAHEHARHLRLAVRPHFTASS